MSRSTGRRCNASRVHHSRVSHVRSALISSSSLGEVPTGIQEARARLGFTPADTQVNNMLVPLGSSFPTGLMQQKGAPLWSSPLRIEPVSADASNMFWQRSNAGAAAPVVVDRRRGSYDDALAIAGNRQAMEQAEIAFEDAKYASDAARVKSSLWKTWVNICTMKQINALPLIAENMEKVCAVLKCAGYRSGVAYLYEAKQRHTRQGFSWCDRLEVAVRDCKRALERYVGPPRKAQEIRLQWFAEMQHVETHAMPARPADRANVWLFASRFLLREGEVGALVLSDGEIFLDKVNRRVTVRLSLSKTDQRARGCRRTLACSCDMTRDGELTIMEDPLCAYCLASELIQSQEFRTGAGGRP